MDVDEISREIIPENETEAVWWSGRMIVMVVDGWIVMVVMKSKGYLRSMTWLGVALPVGF